MNHDMMLVEFSKWLCMLNMYCVISLYSCDKVQDHGKQ